MNEDRALHQRDSISSSSCPATYLPKLRPMSSGNPSNSDLAPPHPPFSSLPLDPNGPPGNAWGRFGAADQLGMLNLLTPRVVAAAAKEIVSGVRISLDWPLNKPSLSCYGRDPYVHEIKQRGGSDRVVNDDILTFNTQISTQWDGFRHYGSFEPIIRRGAISSCDCTVLIRLQGI